MYVLITLPWIRVSRYLKNIAMNIHSVANLEKKQEPILEITGSP